MLIAWIACGWFSGFWSALSGARISMGMQCTLDWHLDCPRLTFWFSPISCFKRRDTVAALQLTWGQFRIAECPEELDYEGAHRQPVWQRSEPVSHVSSESSSLTTQQLPNNEVASWFSTLRRGRFRSAAPPQTASERTSRRTFTREGLPSTSSTTRGSAGSFKSQNKTCACWNWLFQTSPAHAPSHFFFDESDKAKSVLQVAVRNDIRHGIGFYTETHLHDFFSITAARSDHDPRPNPSVHNPPRNRGSSSRSPRAFCMEKYLAIILNFTKVLRLPRKSDTWTWTSPSTAPATKSDTWTWPSTAPATQNDSHDWSSSHMERHWQCVEQQEPTLQCHQILRLPRKITNQNLTEICSIQLQSHLQCAANPSMIRPWSKTEPVSPTTCCATQVTFRARHKHFVWKNDISRYCAGQEKWHLNFSEILRLLRKVTFELDRKLHLPRYYLTLRWLDSTITWLYYCLPLLRLDSAMTWLYHYLPLLLLDAVMTWLYYYLTL